MLKKISPFVSCVLLFSCAKPTAPESLTPGSGGYAVVAKLQLPGYAADVDVNDTLAYVAEGEGGVAVVSVADRGRPRLLGICEDNRLRGYAYKLARKDSIVILAAGGFGINTVNVGSPTAPSFVQRVGGANSVVDLIVFGKWLIEGKSEDGVRFADLDESGVPGYVSYKGYLYSPGYAHGLATTRDSTLLVSSGEMGLTLYDLRDIETYAGGPGYYDERKGYASWIDLPGYAVSVALMGDQRIAFVACGTAGVQVVDFSDTTLNVIGSYPTGGYAKEVAYSNGRLYVATELRGLQVLSVVNPSNPVLVGVIDTEYALGLAVDQHYVYVADETEGLIIVAIPS